MLYLRLLFLFIIGSIGAFANCNRQNDVTEWIFEEAGNAIRYVDNNRIYLHSSKVQISNEHIFLINDFNEMIPISSLFSSENGLYVETSNIRIFNLWKCHVCDYWNANDSDICEKCHTFRGEER